MLGLFEKQQEARVVGGDSRGDKVGVSLICLMSSLGFISGV